MVFQFFVSGVSYIHAKFECSTAVQCRVNRRHWTDGRTDEQTDIVSVTLNAAS